uniref:Auxin efflux carrier component n=1 Tax=Chenopodium quinoa TaxID=63459 RepID=A0A803MJ56_CHEQI
MGIPLLKGMYGDSSGELIMQIVVLQCIIWYTILLVMFEFRSARLLISERFPDNSELITSVKVDSDVVSLDGKEGLETEAKIGDDGKIHVKVRKSMSFRSEGFRVPSNLTNVDIYSLQSSKRVSSFNEIDTFYSFVNDNRKGGGSSSSRSLGVSSFRNFGFDEEKQCGGGGEYRKPSTGGIFAPVEEPTPRKEEMMNKGDDSGGRGLHVFKGSDENYHVHEGKNANPKDYDNYGKDGLEVENKCGKNGQEVEGPMLNHCSIKVDKAEPKTAALCEPKPTSMPPATVMTKLILIMVSRKLTRNPNTYASIIGLVWALISFRWQVEMPVIVANSVKILSDGGLGMAIFSLGLFMALQPKIIAGGHAMAAYAAVVRFFIGPAIMATASAIVGLKGVLLKVAILQATLPQAILPFVFAKEYNLHPEILSTAEQKNVGKGITLYGDKEEFIDAEKEKGSGDSTEIVASPIIGTSNKGVIGEMRTTRRHMEENNIIIDSPCVFNVGSATATKQGRKKFKAARSRGREFSEMETDEDNEERGSGKRKAVVQSGEELSVVTQKKARGILLETGLSDTIQVTVVDDAQPREEQ